MVSLCETNCMLLQTLDHNVSCYSDHHVWLPIVIVNIDDSNVKVVKSGINTGSKVQFSTEQMSIASAHF